MKKWANEHPVLAWGSGIVIFIGLAMLVKYLIDTFSGPSSSTYGSNGSSGNTSTDTAGVGRAGANGSNTNNSNNNTAAAGTVALIKIPTADSIKQGIQNFVAGLGSVAGNIAQSMADSIANEICKLTANKVILMSQLVTADGEAKKWCTVVPGATAINDPNCKSATDQLNSIQSAIDHTNTNLSFLNNLLSKAGYSAVGCKAVKNNVSNAPSTDTTANERTSSGTTNIPTTEAEKATARQAFVDNLNATINGRQTAELPKCNCESVDIPEKNGGGSYLSKYRTGEGASCSEGCLFNVNSGLPTVIAKPLLIDASTTNKGPVIGPIMIMSDENLIALYCFQAGAINGGGESADYFKIRQGLLDFFNNALYFRGYTQGGFCGRDSQVPVKTAVSNQVKGQKAALAICKVTSLLNDFNKYFSEQETTILKNWSSEFSTAIGKLGYSFNAQNCTVSRTVPAIVSPNSLSRASNNNSNSMNGVAY